VADRERRLEVGEVRDRLELRDELERHRVPLLVANMPGGSFDGATGRYV
jgi:hypothetical protein